MHSAACTAPSDGAHLQTQGPHQWATNKTRKPTAMQVEGGEYELKGDKVACTANCVLSRSYYTVAHSMLLK